MEELTADKTQDWVPDLKIISALTSIEQPWRPTEQGLPLISVIVATNRLKNLDTIYENFMHQLYLNKELIIILNNNLFNLSVVKKKFNAEPRIIVLQLDETKSLGHCLNQGIEQSKGDYIAKMDDDDYYGAHYLHEQLFYLQQYNAGLVGKCASFAYLESINRILLLKLKKNKPILRVHAFSFLLGSTLFFNKNIVKKNPFDDKNIGEDSGFLRMCLSQKIPVFATSPYNYLRIRYQDKSKHTAQASDLKKYIVPWLFMKIAWLYDLNRNDRGNNKK